MWLPIIGLIFGFFVGFQSNVVLPSIYSSYVAIGILACADSVLGGIRSSLDKVFNLNIFLSGFFGNALLAIALVWLGNQLNIPLSLAAIVVFGSRLFQNFAFIRRFYIKKE